MNSISSSPGPNSAIFFSIIAGSRAVSRSLKSHSYRDCIAMDRARCLEAIKNEWSRQRLLIMFLRILREHKRTAAESTMKLFVRELFGVQWSALGRLFFFVSVELFFLFLALFLIKTRKYIHHFTPFIVPAVWAHAMR